MNFKQWLKLDEIQNTTSLLKSKIDYDEFVDWAKSEADKINQEKEKFSNFDFQWAESPDNTKIIAYQDNIPLGYVALEKFKDGYKIDTLGVKPSARGKGLASTIYDYIISKTKLYSDKMQTPEAKKLWIKLFNKYKVFGFNKTTNKMFDLTVKDNELISKNPELSLYSDYENDNYLVVFK